MESNANVEILGLWQEQTSTEPVTALDQIRIKAERLDVGAQRQRLMTTALFAVLVIVEAFQVWFENAPLERAGDSLTIAALLYVAYRFRKQRMAAPPGALGRSNCVDFYRLELVRQRDLSKDSWGYLLPFAPGVFLALFGSGFENRSPGQIAGIIAFGIALFLGAAFWNALTARKLQREIDRLNGL